MAANRFKIESKSSNGRNIFSRVENMMKIDAAFESGIPVKYMPYVLFLAGVALFYIGNSHFAEKNVRKIDALEKEVEDLRADYTTLKSDYMFASKQSEVAKNVAELGIKESLQPPEKVVLKDEH
ncbi:FtsL-like putative cell division protein [Fulvivirga lutea]|uniref:Cell division protein FtsL n=1 Tax=Fulvivirga lutea TaxID=2810512 RepID=A0A974WJP9_9BACT|nr:FtsL-like putative cell division protein [Fulvivirga lutea]QSE99038.1 hypothetical protein JR347_08115 [Fulvivirga lutea]